MPEETEVTAKRGPAASKEEVALELMKFISATTSLGKGGATAGYGGKTLKSPEEQVDVLLQLYEKCRAAVGK